MLVDTHAHLDFNDFSADRMSVIQRAFDSDVTMIFNIGTGLESSKISLQLAHDHDNVFAVVGVHPHDADVFVNNEDGWSVVENLCGDEKVVAIGEVGLDYYRNYSDHGNQKTCFKRFIQMAAIKEKPLVIHSREAFVDVIGLLEDHKENLRGVFHCFSGDVKMARKVLDIGFYISFAGPLTYPSSNVLRDVAAYVPPDRILIETDCPFLSPQKHRGKRNEPAYVRRVFDKLCDVRKENQDNIESRLRENVKDLFGV